MLYLSIRSNPLLDHTFSRNDQASVQALHGPPRLLQAWGFSHHLLFSASFVQDAPSRSVPVDDRTSEVKHYSVGYL